MIPFYALLALGGLLLVALLFSLLSGRRERLRGQPFERRRLLSADERRCYLQITEAVGADYRVFPKVAAHALLRPMRRIGRRQGRLAQERLRDGCADLLICTAADAHPLCVVSLSREKLGRKERRIAAQLRAAVSAAGMPVVELSLDELPSSERLRGLVREAIEMADVRVLARPEPTATRFSADEEEAELLSELSAAMREPESPLDQR